MKIKSIKSQRAFTLINFIVSELIALYFIRSGDATYYQFAIIMAIFYGVIWNLITAKPDNHKYNYVNFFFLVGNVILIFIGIVGCCSDRAMYLFIIFLCFAIVTLILLFLKYRLHKL